MKGVPIANFADAKPGKRGLKVAMSPEMENRFIVTNVAVYIVAGGVGKVTDLVLVAQLFPQYNLKKVKDLWCKIRKRRGKEIPIIEARFQEAFLRGYESQSRSAHRCRKVLEMVQQEVFTGQSGRFTQVM